MNGPDTRLVKAFIETWAKTELKMPKRGEIFPLLLKLCIKHLECYSDPRWEYMDQAKLNEFGLRAKTLRSYIHNKLLGMGLYGTPKE